MLEMPGKVTLEHNRPLAAPMFHPLEPIVTVSLGSRVQARGGRRKPGEGGRQRRTWNLVGGLCPPEGGVERPNGSEGPQRFSLPL